MKIIDICKYIISLGLIYILSINYGKDIINIIKLVNIDYIILIIFISLIQYILSAYRWKYISKYTNLNISFINSIKFYYISTFMNNILPGGIMGDIFRIYHHVDDKKEIFRIGRSFQSVVYERLSGQLMLLSFFILSLGLYFIINQKYIAFSYLFLPLIAAFYFLKYIFNNKLRKYIRSKHYGNNFLTVFTGEVFWRHTVLSFFVMMSYIFIYIISAVSLGVKIDYFSFLVFTPIILFSMTLPVSIGGWGVREFAALLISFLLGLSASVSISVAIMYGILNLICSLPGLYFLLKLKSR
tara:strand:- start:511 stop:1404 length:894 start_codon:yes stop_codon:yes gene_type:complete